MLEVLGLGAPGWLSRLSTQLLLLRQVIISESWDQAQHQSLSSARSLPKILSPLFPSPTLLLLWSHAFPLSNKEDLKKKKKKEVIGLVVKKNATSEVKRGITVNRISKPQGTQSINNLTEP